MGKILRRFETLKRTPVAIVALLGIVVFIVLFKSQNSTNQLPLQIQENSDSNQLLLEWQEVTATGVGNDEKERIVSFVDTFESAIAQRDSDKVLSFFSAPETDEEQNELDFILGSDYARDGTKPLARLFTTAGYNFSRVAHYVRGVAAQGADRRVLIDEMRVIPSGGEWVGYFANVSHLVVELRATPHGYEIVRYYHDGEEDKYEGFIAE